MWLLDIDANLDAANVVCDEVVALAKTISAGGIADVPEQEIRSFIEEIDARRGEGDVPRR